MAQDVYQRVTDKLVEQLEAGVRPWAKPWGSTVKTGGVLPIRWNGEAYSGVNTLLLWGEGMARGFVQRRWMTFNQAKDLGAGVRKGAKSTVVVYANKLMRTEENDAGEEVERAIPFMKAYNVFNIEEIDGLPEHYFEAVTQPEPNGCERIAAAETFFRRICADIRHGGNAAFFMPGLDYIQLPPFAAFKSTEDYYGTAAHEAVHWTGHASRLGREFGKRFGDQAYAAEELVAEVGAAFVCAMLGIEAEPREDHASYLANWIKVLKSDKRAIFTAASAAQRAADFLAERAGLRGQKEKLAA